VHAGSVSHFSNNRVRIMKRFARITKLQTVLAFGPLGPVCSQPVAAQLADQDGDDLRAVGSSALASLTSGDAATFVAVFREAIAFQPQNDADRSRSTSAV